MRNFSRENPLTFDNAQQTCGELASIHTAEENAFVHGERLRMTSETLTNLCHKSSRLLPSFRLTSQQHSLGEPGGLLAECVDRTARHAPSKPLELDRRHARRLHHVESGRKLSVQGSDVVRNGRGGRNSLYLGGSVLQL